MTDPVSQFWRLVLWNSVPLVVEALTSWLRWMRRIVGQDRDHRDRDVHPVGAPHRLSADGAEDHLPEAVRVQRQNAAVWTTSRS